MKQIRIISRNSTLARLQANIVGDEIKKTFPEMEITYLAKETHGDIDLTTPLSKMPEMGVFTNDIRDELINDNADIAVHSWKDLPVEMPSGTMIVATTKRADQRDILLFKPTSITKKYINILTSSPRRAENLSNFLPQALPNEPTDINFLNIRGNIFTRIEKFMTSDADGLVLAKAALDRLINATEKFAQSESQQIKNYLQQLKWMVLPLSENPAAAAQGALAIEVKSDNDAVIELMQSINEPDFFAAVARERATLKSYGGGCHQKIGASYELLNMGAVATLKGLTESGEALDSRIFEPHKQLQNTGMQQIKNIYPTENETEHLFERQEFPESKQIIESINSSGIYVSRANALPSDTVVDPTNIIWTSGVETWFKLAKRGYWVNGTSDSLGEMQSPPGNMLEDLKWYKLSHDKSEEGDKAIITTYTLSAKPLPKKINEVSHFYWMSATSFQHAIKQCPEIMNANHSCGMGKTFEIINNIIPGKVYPYLGYKYWLREIKKSQ